MASTRSVALSALLIAGARSQDESFSWVQPLNTTILTQYGSSPPVYPSPNATGAGGWVDALAKAKAFVAQLTLDEKATLVTGDSGPCVGNIDPVPRLGFPGLCLQDGPLALRQADYVSVFSSPISVGATWNRTLMYERGLGLGEEFKGKGAHIMLGPVSGPLGRTIYDGRLFEGFSSDAYLAGVGMEQTILGVQKAGVQACAKHYIGNEQETARGLSTYSNGSTKQEAISSNMDDRTLHELYLWPFANAVHANVSAIMCSYNRVNGSYACANSKLLNGLLKGELGFQGYVLSDWGATHTGVAAISAGLDMEMPGFSSDGKTANFGLNVAMAVNNGSLAASRLDDMLVRILTPYFALNQDQHFPSVDPSSGDLNGQNKALWQERFNLTGPSSRDVRGGHGVMIRRQGAEAAVLLKNERGALPLAAPMSIVVFGNDAGDKTNGLVVSGNYEMGTMAVGGGSGTGRPTYVVTPLEAIKSRAAGYGALVQFFLNNTRIAANQRIDWIPKMPDVCLVFLKTYMAEGDDRQRLSSDWNGDGVVAAVANVCNNTVVVTHAPGPNTMPWADHPNVTAIIAAHYPGQESGNSIVDVLYGDVNPSARLPYTVAREAVDYNAPPTTSLQTQGTDDWQSWFTEGLEIDYRYFDAHNIPVRYEFGFGLSYTTFGLSALSIKPANDAAIPAVAPPADVSPGGNPALWDLLYTVTASVTNSGAVDGAAVAQLYLSFPPSTPAGTPPRQLRGFDKVFLKARETRTASFPLMRRDVSYWDVVSQQWVIPSGNFTVSVGFSSRNLVVNGTMTPVLAATRR